MTTNQNNILYASRFDGDMFEYHSKNLLGPILWLLGFKQTINTPVNVVLGYRRREMPFRLTFLELTVNKYRLGRDTPNPICFPPILFVGRNNEMLLRLTIAMEKSILQSKNGLNVGLMNVDVNKFREFHSTHFSSNESQDQNFLSSGSRPKKQLGIGSNFVNSNTLGGFRDVTAVCDNLSRVLVVNKEIPRDAGG